MSHKLTPKQIKAIYLLAAGATTIEAGKALKLRRETLSRWKQIPDFVMEFDKVMEEQRESMNHRLTHLAGDSIDTVSKEIKSGEYAWRRLETALNMLKLFDVGKILAPKISKQEQK